MMLYLIFSNLLYTKKSWVKVTKSLSTEHMAMPRSQKPEEFYSIYFSISSRYKFLLSYFTGNHFRWPASTQDAISRNQSNYSAAARLIHCAARQLIKMPAREANTLSHTIQQHE
jgi:hypothetical protein